jgi:SAM-dependent methyltransferase
MSEQKAERHYTGEQGRQYHENKRGIPESAYPWVARLRALKISPYIHNSDVVFEYGIGTGWNLAEINCRRRMGYDVSLFLEEKVRSRGIEFVRDTKWMENFSVDVALCHHALEHVANPPAVLQELRRMLCANGKLLLYVPFEKEARYQHFDPEEPNHHLYSWNVQTLGNLVTEAGFKVIEAKLGEFGYDRFAAASAERFNIGEAGFRFIRRLAQTFRPMREVRIVAVKAEPVREVRPDRSSRDSRPNHRSGRDMVRSERPMRDSRSDNRQGRPRDARPIRPEQPSQPRRERPSGENRDRRGGRSAFRGRNPEGGESSR